MPGREVVIDVRELGVSYDGVHALRSVTMWEIRSGEIHALVGHNGSGKTTFLHLIAGHLPGHALRTGSLRVNDDEVLDFWDASIAKQHGIYLVSQDPVLCASLSAFENIVLGAERTTRRLTWDRDVDFATVKRLTAESGLKVDLQAPASALSASEKQKVAILRGLFRTQNNGFLLLDEPTTHLTKGEIVRLFKYLRQQATRRKVGVIVVSHELFPLKQAVDRVTIFLRGCVTGTYSPTELSTGSEFSVAAPLPPADFVSPTRLSQAVLSLAVSVAWRKTLRLNLAVHESEVVMVFAPEEDILDDLFLYLAGLPTALVWHGAISFAGERVDVQPIWSRRAAGMGFVSADRVGDGIFSGLTIYENLAIQPTGTTHRLYSRNAMEKGKDLFRQLGASGVTPNSDVSSLSGGFKQRLILLREWDQKPKLLILRNPTQGLDAQRREFMLSELQSFCREGGAVMILGKLAADRAIDGSIVRHLSPEEQRAQ